VAARSAHHAYGGRGARGGGISGGHLHLLSSCLLISPIGKKAIWGHKPVGPMRERQNWGGWRHHVGVGGAKNGA
jgi:hypothetical protein